MLRWTLANNHHLFLFMGTGLGLWGLINVLRNPALGNKAEHLPLFGAGVLGQAIILMVLLSYTAWTRRLPGRTLLHDLHFIYSLACLVHTLTEWPYKATFWTGAVWAICASHGLWKALHWIGEAGKRMETATAMSPTEADADAYCVSMSRGESLTQMLFAHFWGPLLLIVAYFDGDLDQAVADFGPIFLTALGGAVLMLNISLPHITRGSNGRTLVFAYRYCFWVFMMSHLVVVVTLAFCKDQSMVAGIGCAGHLASGLYVGIAEVLERCLSDPDEDSDAGLGDQSEAL